MKRFIGIWLLALIPAALLGWSPAGQGGCTASEYHQLDFWIGDWNVYDVDDSVKVVARARIDGMLEGCALREVYQGTNGLTGESFSGYDAARKVWHQSWVTNRGQQLLLDGAWEGDGMVLTGPRRAPDGSQGLIRGTWRRVKDAVRETAGGHPAR